MAKGNIEDHVSALIVASPGRMRDGLRALLRNVPRIGAILQADDSSSSLEMIVKEQPALVLLDSKLADDDIQNVLQQIKIESPQTRCIVLADNSEQQWLAKTAGADSVLLTGYSTEILFATIEGVLSWPRNIFSSDPNPNKPALEIRNEKLDGNVDELATSNF
ncbi:MAG: response regulator transcription factor [Anaerolineae bacterium]|nr:response regulator transcription factor [Anaerolineae bacterium]